MIRLAISQAAFEAITSTLPVGFVVFDQGERLIWLEAAVVDKFGAMRRPGESYSDVILWLVEIEARSPRHDPA